MSEPRSREARDYDVRLTLSDGSWVVHKSRASSPTYALRLAVDVAIREDAAVVKAEVV